MRRKTECLRRKTVSPMSAQIESAIGSGMVAMPGPAIVPVQVPSSLLPNPVCTR